jgi:membrane protein
VAKRNKNPSARPGLVHELRTRVTEHRLPVFAAAIAFFAFIAFIPALAAAVSITGLVTDTDKLVSEAESALASSPAPTREFVVEQIRSAAEESSGSAGFTVAVGIALSVFSASGAVGNVMVALNEVFDRRENRNFVVKRLTAIIVLLGALVLIASMVFAMSIIPAQLNDWFDSGWVRGLVTAARFVVLGAVMTLGLSLLYRLGPARNVERDRELVPGGVPSILTKGSVVGTVLLVLLSWGFGVFVNNFGSYGATYGALATIVVMLLWLQLMALAVLLGAEIDARTIRERLRNAREKAGLSAMEPHRDR